MLTLVLIAWWIFYHWLLALYARKLASGEASSTTLNTIMFFHYVMIDEVPPNKNQTLFLSWVASVLITLTLGENWGIRAPTITLLAMEALIALLSLLAYFTNEGIDQEIRRKENRH